MSLDPFIPFNDWLEWLDSHDGRLYRRSRGDKEDDYDFLTLIPTPPGQTVFLVGDLRRLVDAGKRLKELG